MKGWPSVCVQAEPGARAQASAAAPTQLLALQDPDGKWAGGAYFPKDSYFEGPEAAEDAGQPYTATTWSLNTLRDWGPDPAPGPRSAGSTKP